VAIRRSWKITPSASAVGEHLLDLFYHRGDAGGLLGFSFYRWYGYETVHVGLVAVEILGIVPLASVLTIGATAGSLLLGGLAGDLADALYLLFTPVVGRIGHPGGFWSMEPALVHQFKA
jgi:hypothetical protein